MDSITGKVIAIGEMKVEGEFLTGVFVEVPMEELKALFPNLLYQKVKVERAQ